MTGRRRLLLGAASAAVMLASFAGTTWLVGRFAGRVPAHAPGLTRAEPQPVALAAPPSNDPSVSGAAAEAAAAPDPDTTRAAAAAAEAAEEAARRDVTAAAEGADEPLEIRLALYLDALEQALEASGDAALLAHRGVWTEHFLRLEPVQAELASLSPGAREVALARIRREMGFAEADVARFAARDEQLEARWAVGLEYMDERRRLEVAFEEADPEVLEDELRRLRERTFGFEAATIEREEAEGFYRFERPRIYGRN